MKMNPINDINRIKGLVRVNQPLNTLSEEDVFNIITSSEALCEGHFQLLSGQHSDVFLKFRSISERSSNGFIRQIGYELASRFQDVKIDVVLGSLKAGSLLVDKVLEKIENSRAVFVEVDKEGRPSSILRKGFKVNPNDHILIINDLVSTGEGMKRMIKVVENNKGILSGIGLFATRNRDVLEQEFRKKTKKIEVLVDLRVKNILSKNCILCENNVPLEYSIDHC